MLVLVRHGEPTSYRDGGLTPLGREQAASAAAAVIDLVQREHLGPLAVHSSPARRCRDTARRIVDDLNDAGLAVVGPLHAPGLAMVRARLGTRLVDVGLARDRATGHEADPDLSSFWDDHSSGRNPFERWEQEAYPTFESPSEVQDRVVGCLRALASPAVVVSHSELIRLAAKAFGVAGAEIGFGEVLVLGTITARANRPGGTS